MGKSHENPMFFHHKITAKCHGFASLIQATRPLPLVKTPRAWLGVKIVQVEKRWKNLWKNMQFIGVNRI
jgi:hypothetical protein